MPDYGLIGGIAEGLRAGISSYKEERKAAQEEALRKRMMQLQELEAAGKLSETFGGVPRGVLSEETEKRLMSEGSDGVDGSGLIKVPGFLSKKEKEARKAEEDRFIKEQELGVTISRDPKGRLIAIPIEEEKLSPKLRQSREDKQAMGLLRNLQIQKGVIDIDEAKRKKETASVSGSDPKLAGQLQTMQDSVDQLEDLLVNKGERPSRVTSETPYVGKFVEDKPADVLIRKVSDDIGRLRSGGAISGDEEARFKNMLPGPQDKSPQAIKFKLNQVKQEIEARRSSIGAKPQARPLSGPPMQAKPQIPEADKAQLQEALSKAIQKDSNSPDVFRLKKILGLQ